MNFTYFAHDLTDAAVARRVTLLQWGGATLRLLGFHRKSEPPSRVSGVKAIGLGQTYDAQLARRAVTVVRTCLRITTLRKSVLDADVVICRNLEMLIMGAIAIAFSGQPRKTRLVYECLDIHRKMLSSGLTGRLLRALEKILLRKCVLILVSSPAFASEYFRDVQNCQTPVLLIENKTQSEYAPSSAAPVPIAGPPWIIGWFGNIRCQRSFEILSSLTERCPNIQIRIAGRPALTEFNDFYNDVHRSNGKIVYLGTYAPDDLPKLYGHCHFTWTIDFFEDGQNSAWLLPNRLYEGGRWGSVPIALGRVQTGKWLYDRKCGVLINDPIPELTTLFASLDRDSYDSMVRSARSIPSTDLVLTRKDAEVLTKRLMG